MAYILNRSSRGIRPKYCLYKKYSYFASSKRRVETKNILKEVGESIPPSAGHSVTRIISIPPTTCASILNCNIIKVEYRLKVCVLIWCFQYGVYIIEVALMPRVTIHTPWTFSHFQTLQPQYLMFWFFSPSGMGDSHSTTESCRHGCIYGRVLMTNAEGMWRLVSSCQFLFALHICTEINKLFSRCVVFFCFGWNPRLMVCPS